MENDVARQIATAVVVAVNVFCKALTINGVPHLVGGSVGGFGFEILPTKDNRFVMICSPYQKHAERIMKLLDTGTLPRQLELATMQWNAEELEKRAQDAEIRYRVPEPEVPVEQACSASFGPLASEPKRRRFWNF